MERVEYRCRTASHVIIVSSMPGSSVCMEIVRAIAVKTTARLWLSPKDCSKLANDITLAAQFLKKPLHTPDEMDDIRQKLLNSRTWVYRDGIYDYYLDVIPKYGPPRCIYLNLRGAIPADLANSSWILTSKTQEVSVLLSIEQAEELAGILRKAAGYAEDRQIT